MTIIHEVEGMFAQKSRVGELNEAAVVSELSAVQTESGVGYRYNITVDRHRESGDPAPSQASPFNSTSTYKVTIEEEA
jgi:hypothetical protein